MHKYTALRADVKVRRAVITMYCDYATSVTMRKKDIVRLRKLVDEVKIETADAEYIVLCTYEHAAQLLYDTLVDQLDEL